MVTYSTARASDLQLHMTTVYMDYGSITIDFFTKLAQAKFIVVNAILCKLYKRESRKKLQTFV